MWYKSVILTSLWFVVIWVTVQDELVVIVLGLILAVKTVKMLLARIKAMVSSMFTS